MNRCKHKDKKNQQLGMNYSTASGRLVKDILFSLLQETNKDICFRCEQKLCRETFSIEHITPWLDSEDPVDLFFNLKNISFSHLSCNTASARKPHKKYFTEEEKQEAKNKGFKKWWDGLPKEKQQKNNRKEEETTTKEMVVSLPSIPISVLVIVREDAAW